MEPVEIKFNQLNANERPVVAIIGGGFCGIMTAVRLSKASAFPIKLVVINAVHPLARGIAYNAYSTKHLLNVPAGKMSAFSDEPDHFMNWILNHNYFDGLTDKALIAGSFLPRKFFGDYLEDIWKGTIEQKNPNVEIEIVNQLVDQITFNGHDYFVLLLDRHLKCHSVVLATGNSVPVFPTPKASGFSKSNRYFGNPWEAQSVQQTSTLQGDVLIVGNGLTMVDTVLGLIERGFHHTIYAISPDGFTILSHRHNGQPYSNMRTDIGEMKRPYKLSEIVSLFRKHVKLVRKLGLSAEPIVDSLRPFTQEIWKDLSIEDKSLFMFRLRHLWGVARHRLPIHIHDIIQRLRIDGKLKVVAGRIVNFSEHDGMVKVTFFNKKSKREETLMVERVINCTGPATDIEESDNALLKNLFKSGLIRKDPLKLGIEINTENFCVINSNGIEQPNFYAMGNLVKGMLWESTAVPELRVQVEIISKRILKEMSLNKAYQN